MATAGQRRAVWRTRMRAVFPGLAHTYACRVSWAGARMLAVFPGLVHMYACHVSWTVSVFWCQQEWVPGSEEVGPSWLKLIEDSPFQTPHAVPKVASVTDKPSPE